MVKIAKTSDWNSAVWSQSHTTVYKLWSLAFHIHQTQSPQKCIFDAKGCRMTKVSAEKFSHKKGQNFKILSYRNNIYLKRKLRTCAIQIHQEKVQFCKENFFFDFFDFRVIVEAGRKFSKSCFLMFSKKNSRNDSTRSCLRLKGTNSESGSNFEASAWELHEIDYSPGHKVPPPPV